MNDLSRTADDSHSYVVVVAVLFLKSKQQSLNRILILLLIPLHVSKQTLCNNTMYTSVPGLVETNLSIFFFFKECKKTDNFLRVTKMNFHFQSYFFYSINNTNVGKNVLLKLLLILSRLVSNKIIRYYSFKT